MMPDREKIIKVVGEMFDMYKSEYEGTSYFDEIEWAENKHDALALLKGQEGLLGIQQTADSITFISTGTAQQGEIRGLLLGKLAMHEWLKKELLYRGLLTDDIKAVFDEAKLQEGR